MALPRFNSLAGRPKVVRGRGSTGHARHDVVDVQHHAGAATSPPAVPAISTRRVPGSGSEAAPAPGRGRSDHPSGIGGTLMDAVGGGAGPRAALWMAVALFGVGALLLLPVDERRRDDAASRVTPITGTDPFADP